MPCPNVEIRHTLFLGCSVSSINSNGGGGEQPSELNVVVVRDPCPADVDKPKYYYDTNCEEQVTTLPDPGFMGEVVPIVGCPAYFRFGSFEFCGIIQSWEKENSTSAKDVYTVKLVSPVKVLQDTQLIIGEYSGPVGPNLLFGQAPNNLINVYGFAEKIGGVPTPLVSQTSPGFYELGDTGIDGAVFGTYAGGFGGAGVNDNGMSWETIKRLFSVLTCAVPTLSNEWAPHGRITHKGADLAFYGSPWTNGYGLLPRDGVINSRSVSHYFVDLTEVPFVPTYFRFPGVNISLLEAISRVMQETGYEYYIEMLPLQEPSASPSGIAKLIKVRVISRVTQPSFGQIQEYVDELYNDEVLIGSSVGREFRNDITSTFLVGGPKQTIYQAFQNTDPEGDGQPPNPEADNVIVPYYGVYENGNMIVPYLTTGVSFNGNGTGAYWEFEADTTSINLSLQEMQLANPLTINELELIFSSSMETWESYIRSHITHSYVSISGELPESEIDTSKIDRMYDNLLNNTKIAARDSLSWDMAYSDIQLEVYKRRVEDKDKIYQYISSLANEYYGKKFAVRVPYTSVVQNSESLLNRFSEQPTNDGGWTEATTVIGLPNGTYYTDFFSSDQGKLQTFVRYYDADGLDLSMFSSDDYIVYDGDLYLRASVDEQYVFHNRTGYQVPRVVVTLPNLVWESEDADSTKYSRIAAADKIFSMLNNSTGKKAFYTDVYNVVAAADIFAEYGRLAYAPDAVAFAMLSNVNNYGPWTSVGPAGGIRVEKNNGLVPWEFGGYGALNTAAQTLANAGVTNTQVTELGSVSVVGYPELPLGAEINSSSALQNKHLVENRTANYDSYSDSFFDGSPFSYQYLNYNYGFTWDGSYGPNITNISIQGDANITTTYNMRTYTPQFGRLAELNAARLREIGQNRMRINREIRSTQYRKSLISSSVGIGGDSQTAFNNVKSQAKALRKALAGNTPHEMLVGQVLPWESGSRSIVVTESIREAVGEMSRNSYENKAFMSMDGLIRPVSMAGRGGLPRYSNATGGVASANNTYVLDTGLRVVGNSTGGSSNLITVRDLNPLSNPAGYDWSELAGKHGGTKGHDFDIVGRGTGVPSGGMILRHGISGDGKNFDYRDDYSFFALRGPMVVHGWGYDTQGKPVPNRADIEASCRSGIFQTSGLTDFFMDDFLQKSHAWPMGPVDLRWDRGRGVWTLSNSEPELYCQLLYHMGPGRPAPALILDSGTYYLSSGASGAITGYSAISGWTATENIYASGTKVKFKYSQTYSRWEVSQDSEVTILVTGTISGGVWDRNITGIKPYRFSFPSFGVYTGPSGNTSGYLMYNTGNMVTGWNRFTDLVTISPGQAKIMKLCNGWLDNGGCSTVTL